MATTMPMAQGLALGPNGGPTPRQRSRRNQEAQTSDRANVTTTSTTQLSMSQPPRLTPAPAQATATTQKIWLQVTGDQSRLYPPSALIRDRSVFFMARCRIQAKCSAGERTTVAWLDMPRSGAPPATLPWRGPARRAPGPRGIMVTFV